MGNRHGGLCCRTAPSSSKAPSNDADPQERPSITVTPAVEGMEQKRSINGSLHHSRCSLSDREHRRPMRSTSSAPGDFGPFVALLLRPTVMSRSRSLSPIAPPMQRYSRHTSVKVTSSKLLAIRQRRLIYDSWRRTVARCRAQGVCFGILVFRELCDHSPHFKLLFNIPPDQDLNLIQAQHSFVRHARIFANMIDLTVRNIDELEVQITPALFVYGRRHFYKMREGFNNKLPQTFSQSMVQTICHVLDDESTPETVHAWEQLLQYILSKLKEGYDFEFIHSKKSRLSHRFGELFITS